MPLVLPRRALAACWLLMLLAIGNATAGESMSANGELLASSSPPWLGSLIEVLEDPERQWDLAGVIALPDRHWQTLPEETLVYPAHDYQERFVSSIAQEKLRNPRLGKGKTLEQFRHIMANLKLPYPTFIDYAVPGNKQCGVCPSDLPQQLARVNVDHAQFA